MSVVPHNNVHVHGTQDGPPMVFVLAGAAHGQIPARRAELLGQFSRLQDLYVMRDVT
jgi:hypothetical protein